MGVLSFIKRTGILIWSFFNDETTVSNGSIEKEILFLLNNGWNVYNLPEYLVNAFYDGKINNDILKKFKIKKER